MKNLLLVSWILFSISIQAQKELSLEQAITEAWTTFYPSSIDQLQWVKETKSYSYVEDKSLRVRFNFSDESNELNSREKRSSDRNQACEMLIAIDEPLYQHYQRNMTKVKKPQESIPVHSLY